jgi:hypothetical protein
MRSNNYQKLLFVKKEGDERTDDSSLGIRPTPLPKKQFLVLSCILISESISITMLFPFVGTSDIYSSIITHCLRFYG